MIKKYKSIKPPIEAVKLTLENIWEASIWCNCPTSSGEDFILIPTLEGIMRANAGDYVIKGLKGEFYPCKSDIFEKSYEVIDE